MTRNRVEKRRWVANAQNMIMRLLSIWQELSHKDKRGVKCKREESKVSNIIFTVSCLATKTFSTNEDDNIEMGRIEVKGLCPHPPLDRFKLDRCSSFLLYLTYEFRARILPCPVCGFLSPPVTESQTSLRPEL